MLYLVDIRFYYGCDNVCDCSKFCYVCLVFNNVILSKVYFKMFKLFVEINVYFLLYYMVIFGLFWSGWWCVNNNK